MTFVNILFPKMKAKRGPHTCIMSFLFAIGILKGSVCELVVVLAYLLISNYYWYPNKWLLSSCSCNKKNLIMKLKENLLLLLPYYSKCISKVLIEF